MSNLTNCIMDIFDIQKRTIDESNGVVVKRYVEKNQKGIDVATDCLCNGEIHHCVHTILA